MALFVLYGVCLGAAVAVVLWVVVNNIRYARQARQNVLNRLMDRLAKLEYIVGPNTYGLYPDTSVNGRLASLAKQVQARNDRQDAFERRVTEALGRRHR